MATYLTIPGETVDDIAFRHYGRHGGTTEMLLEANRGLAAEGPLLRGRLLVELPDLPEEPTARPVKLYD